MRLFTLDDPHATTIHTGSTPRDIAAIPGAGQMSVGPDHTRITLNAVRLAGATWDIQFRFDAGVLAWVGLTARRPGDAQSWAEWSMNQESARKAFHEEWATRTLGARFEPLRVEVDGKWISTQWPEPAPKQATMEWGQLRSVYDSHAATAMLSMMLGFVGG